MLRGETRIQIQIPLHVRDIVCMGLVVDLRNERTALLVGSLRFARGRPDGAMLAKPSIRGLPMSMSS